MNLFEINGKMPKEELITILAKGENLRIERIISSGEVSPEDFWYDQDEDELVFLIQGSARLQLEAGEILLNQGDWQIIPAHQKHRVVFTSKNPPAIWLCIFGRGFIGQG